MIYEIPIEKIADVEKFVNRIRNKGAQIIYNVIREFMKEYAENKFHKFVEVEVEGSYQVDGWEFVGVIEHKGNGNIIRKISSDFDVPARYRTAPAECEHCRIPRHRNDTYLVYNAVTREYKQVGSTCIKDYTGLDAETCAASASFFDFLSKEEDYSEGSSLKPDNYYKTSVVIKYAYDVVKEKGYSSETGDSIRDEILDNIISKKSTRCSEVDIERLTSWVDTLDAYSEYLHNAKTAYESEYSQFRDIKLIASLINNYFKDQLRRSANATSEYKGEVGDKISFIVDTCKVIYSKGAYAYNGPTVNVWEIVDTNEYTYIWSTDKEIKPGDHIQAAVKEHKEFRGLKQTVITRGKIN